MIPLAIVLAATKPVVLSVGDLLASTSKYDNKTVSVKGKVDRFKSGGSEDHPFYLFKLTQAGKQVSVYGQGKLKANPSDGSTVIVTGLFAHERHVGDRTYKDEIDASAKLDKTYGVLLKGNK